MFKAKAARRKKGWRGELEELITLLRAYVVQETVGPLRGLGRYVGFGLLGSVFMALSVLFAGLGLLRTLQYFAPVFSTTWSFVPYIITAVLMLLILVLLMSVIARGGSKTDETDTPLTTTSRS